MGCSFDDDEHLKKVQTKYEIYPMPAVLRNSDRFELIKKQFQFTCQTTAIITLYAPNDILKERKFLY